ncbi:MAG: flavin reductase [Alphaproteobacteria bacterium]|nr:MAG: flavin reductase [Alphaproteobacteria bacterium]
MTGDLFRAGMRRLCGGVTIVTSWDGDRPVGLTATAVCSLSAAPPRLIACINREGRTCRAIGRSRVLSVNLLATQHQGLAERFAGRLGDEERFAMGRWRLSAPAAPVLEDALAAFICQVAFMLDVGSHALIVADVEHVILGPAATPLLYLDGRFDRPSLGPVQTPPAPAPDAGSPRPAAALSPVSPDASASREEEISHER